MTGCETHTEAVGAVGWRAVYTTGAAERRVVLVLPLACWLTRTCDHGVTAIPMVHEGGRLVEARNLVGEPEPMTFAGLVPPGFSVSHNATEDTEHETILS